MSTTQLDYDLNSKQYEVLGSTINPLQLRIDTLFKVNTSTTIFVNNFQNVVNVSVQSNNISLEYIKQNIRAGTGGSILDSMKILTLTTGGTLYGLKSPLNKCNSNKDEVYSTADTLSTIRSSLSLNMKEMAKILKVERQTVYSWIGGSSEPHPSNKSRLNEIRLIAKYWETLSPLPVGNSVRQSNRDGRSIVDLLSEDILDKQEIYVHLKLLANNQTLDKTSQKAQSNPSVRELAARHKLKIRENSDTIDWLTGKRIYAE